MEIKTFGVVGAGQMGNGIAQVVAASGLNVIMNDIKTEFVEKGLASITLNLQRAVDKGKLSAGDQAALQGRIKPSVDLKDMAAADFVVEAATENEPLKFKIFKDLDTICRAGVILASNTSSISITRIASFTGRPERVIGMHFFNPAPVMKLIELIRGMATADATFQLAKDLCLKMGKTPVEAQDLPGFISSRLIFSFMNEGIFSLYEGLGKKEEIDAIMRMGANHPMGPIELADLVGLDTVLSVMHVLQEAFGDKYRPCPLLFKYVEAGYLGVKTGRGFYDYASGGKK